MHRSSGDWSVSLHHYWLITLTSSPTDNVNECALFKQHRHLSPYVRESSSNIWNQDRNEEALLEYVPFHTSLASTEVVSIDPLRPADRPNTDVITFICPFRVGVRFGPVCRWASNQ